MSLRYPDADDPQQFWENILAGRRAFRDLPPERMNPADYWSPDPAAPDRFYSTKAAVLRNFSFDRQAFGISGSTYRATDLTHWLALTVAQEAWRDSGLDAGSDAAARRERTAVVLGNSLTGEFSRASLMRLRWPYVRRVVGQSLADQGWDREQVETFLDRMEPTYKAPFAPIDEDTLAGGLSNTIAGRICNHFDFHGGGFTVDGACSSSLLSVVTAAQMLVEGDADVALAGGVDLSIDPFEVIGFAKTGALATSTMLVYDEDSNGFWPGEGCGVAVLMREEDALRAGAKIYAVLAGWGVSSDGAGGITRPEMSGHRTALRRAYDRAGYPMTSVQYFEGHGTGTAVGDATEIAAIAGALEEAGRSEPAALGSVKGNIGHTKAAAGVAAFLKTCLAVHHGVVPPGTGQNRPHPALAGKPLQVPAVAAPFPAGEVARAGVSAMGFGGINAHLTLEAAARAEAPEGVDDATRAMVAGRQDAELLVFSAPDTTSLLERIDALAAVTPRLAFAELADVAAGLASAVDPGHPARAAVVAADPEQALARLTDLREAVARGDSRDGRDGVLHLPAPAGAPLRAPRVGFLFPGQGAVHADGGFLARRFPEVPAPAGPRVEGRDSDTQVAQPRIVTASVHALAVLGAVGVRAGAALGHSLGELTALHWAGSLAAPEAVRLAGLRGEVMARESRPGGAMAGVFAPAAVVSQIIAAGPDRDDVVVAGYNAPSQTVVSGTPAGVARVLDRAREQGLAGAELTVSHAFHSPQVAPAATAFRAALAGEHFAAPAGTVISTVTGEPLAVPEGDDARDDFLHAYLGEQIVRPVRFADAVEQLADQVDLLVEVGPGSTLTRLAQECRPRTPAVAVRSDAAGAAPLLTVVGACFAVGAVHDLGALFTGRVTRPLPEQLTFLASPCEAAPETFAGAATTVVAPAGAQDAAQQQPDGTPAGTLDTLRQVVADRMELPLERIDPGAHPLDELHLSSITVSQIAVETARRLGKGPLPPATNLATVTLAELAEAIGSAEDVSVGAVDPLHGIEPWIRGFRVELADGMRGPILSGPRAGAWSVRGDVDDPERVEKALGAARLGPGVLVVVTPDRPVSDGTLRAAAVEVLDQAATTLVVLDVDEGAAAFARSFALENPQVPVAVITTDRRPDEDGIAALVAREVQALGLTHWVETRLDEQGARRQPRLALWEPDGHGEEAPLASGDVLLITGGGKGIAAECGLGLARRWGVSLALMGRSDPATDPELAANLKRFDEYGVSWAYAPADVTDPEAVRGAVGHLIGELGPVRGVLHGAGTNQPKRVRDLTDVEVETAFAVKVGGFTTVLDAVDELAPGQLRLVVAFASIIGRAGLDGESHYAAANARLTAACEQLAVRRPGVRVHSLEWSVWAGSGMGERLGVLQGLEQRGITPIGVDAGVRYLADVLEAPGAPVTLVVCGRTGDWATLARARRPLPLGRYLESARIDYPGVELVCDSTLSLQRDPYLADHELDGDFLFPAVMGLEAMAQAVGATLGADGAATAWTVLDAEFLHPVVVPAEGELTLRLCTLVDGDRVRVALRTSATGFAVDHFRTTWTARAGSPSGAVAPVVPEGAGEVDGAGLYGPLFFQGRRFQRVVRYLDLGARRAVAELDPVDRDDWFAGYLPSGRVLGSPGLRDSLMHVLQCCVPDAVLLPVGVERLELAADFGAGPVLVHAAEVAQEGDEYVYDVVARDEAGAVLEAWHGLRLRAVRAVEDRLWVAPVMASYLQRSVERMTGVSIEVGVGQTADRVSGTRTALARALARDPELLRRPDGRPEVVGSTVTVSHTGDVTLAVTSSTSSTSHADVACDIEVVTARPAADWAGMLGRPVTGLAEAMRSRTGDPWDVAATRAWGALECLRKLGRSDAGLTLDPAPDPEGNRPGGWVRLAAGSVELVSRVVEIAGVTGPVVVTVAVSRAAVQRLAG